MLGKITTSASEEQRDLLAALITENKVDLALRVSKNNTTADLVGLTYEFMETINDRYKDDAKQERPAFHIVRMLTAVFDNIQLHGLIPSTKCAEGWMCPLYKKNDRTDIVNYCPITCLNVDYKLFTKQS